MSGANDDHDFPGRNLPLAHSTIPSQHFETRTQK